jgi:hypothetical protein
MFSAHDAFLAVTTRIIYAHIQIVIKPNKNLLVQVNLR